MQEFLVFGLTASLGAMGELAGHERRGGLIWPARSAIIGLMGAALGIDRDGDFTGLDALELSVAIFDSGSPLRDFHTIQSVPSATVKNPNSRPEALLTAGQDVATSITLRDYRAGVFYGVAVWGGDLPPLVAALKQPHYTLYLGRKSCPLAAPLGAKLVRADSTEDALTQVVLPPWRKDAAAYDLVESDPMGAVVMDMPRDRKLWHFDARRVASRRIFKAGGAA